MISILESLIPLVLTLVVVMLVIYLSYWFSKRVALGAAGQGSGKYMKVIDRVPVAQDKLLLIVQVSSRYFLLSVASSGIQVLSELRSEDMAEIDKDKAARDMNFKDALQKMMSKKDKS